MVFYIPNDLFDCLFGLIYWFFYLSKGDRSGSVVKCSTRDQGDVGSSKLGRSKPPPVLTSGFNRLKPPWSISQKVVNTGQYESEWSIENFKWPF